MMQDIWYLGVLISIFVIPWAWLTGRMSIRWKVGERWRCGRLYLTPMGRLLGHNLPVLFLPLAAALMLPHWLWGVLVIAVTYASFFAGSRKELQLQVLQLAKRMIEVQGLSASEAIARAQAVIQEGMCRNMESETWPPDEQGYRHSSGEIHNWNDTASEDPNDEEVGEADNDADDSEDEDEDEGDEEDEDGDSEWDLARKNEQDEMSEQSRYFEQDVQGSAVLLPEESVTPLLRHLCVIWNNVGGIPEPFLQRISANPHEVEGAFDPNSLVRAFSKLTLRNGHVLDYVYAADGHGGQPLLYARPSDANPLSSPSEYYSRFGLIRRNMLLGQEPTPRDTVPYLAQMEFERTPEGCFQFAFFCMVASRFYLYWHSNYNTRQWLFDSRCLQAFVEQKAGELSSEQRRLLLAITPNPKITIGDYLSEVNLLNYEQNRGVSFLRVRVTHPNVLRGIADDVLVESRTRTLY